LFPRRIDPAEHLIAAHTPSEASLRGSIELSIAPGRRRQQFAFPVDKEPIMSDASIDDAQRARLQSHPAMPPPSPTMQTVPASRPMPVFYSRAELLSSEHHSRKSLASQLDQRFAKNANSVPLNGVEFELAQRHYPIVFSDEAAPFPIAVLGLRSAENQFIGSADTWQDGVYIPAYVRRYPFIFMTDGEQKQFALCIDAASPFVVDGDSNPFFRDGQPTDLTKNALAFCSAFQAEYDKTVALVSALTEHKVLESKTADIDLGGGQKLIFGPFRVVDGTRLAALPNAVIADWLRRGWLGWIYAHLMSSANWASLANRLRSPS
jgi:hypothetical protein